MTNTSSRGRGERTELSTSATSSRRRLLTGGVILLALAVSLFALWETAAHANPSLADQRARARAISTEISSLDHALDDIVARFVDATRRLRVLDADIRRNEKRLKVAEFELALAEEALSERAVAMYKERQTSLIDVLVNSASFNEMVHELTFLRKLRQYDEHIVADMESARAEVLEQRLRLVAAQTAARQLVTQRAKEKERIEASLHQRQAVLAGLRDEIERLEAQLRRPVVVVRPALGPATGEYSGQGDQGGENSDGWWPLIHEAAERNGISATGLYRLMMIESGGNSSVIGGAGDQFCGLFQYYPATWEASWNPWRKESIFNGAAQIKATALAIKMGKGPAWWGPCYEWAFGTD
ncbi:MAG: hypothetical protein GX537_02595 [Actinobacteria bacterium]|nr:hypothetical protein [Actinomycetota bacterium]